MTRRIFSAVLLFTLAMMITPVLQAQKGPVAGERYKVTYYPAADSPLSSSPQLQLLYVFDFWNVRYGTRLALWQNVLSPDTARLHVTDMKKSPGGWSAEIAIPADAALLSYVVKSGDMIDGNNEKTFTSYVYDINGKPVENARFFNIAFLQLAKAEIGAVVQEAEREITEFPENFGAYHKYFQLLLEQAKGSARIQQRIANRLDQLEQRHGADPQFLNMAAETWYYVLQDQEKGLEYRKKVVPDQQWPQVFRMFDQDSKQEEMRQRQMQAEQYRNKLLNSEMPAFNLHDSDGQKIQFPKHDGKARVLAFWASSSANSIKMLGLLRDVGSEVSSEEVEMIAVNVDLDEKKGIDVFEREAYPFVQLFNQGATLQLLGVDSIPITFVVDGDGVIRSILVGFSASHAETLRNALGKLLE